MAGGVMRWNIFRVLAIFLAGTMAMALYMTIIVQREDDGGQGTAAEYINLMREEMRGQMLRDMQRLIFVNPLRPPDEVYNVNITLSERIPLVRTITDTRPPACKAVRYEENGESALPTVSVIIPFYNEALSLLLRTVHSVLSRTPPHLLADVLLIDDHSTNQDLQIPLESYVKLLPSKVTLVRVPQREGLIRARLIGAKLARGEVLFFQDAHTESNVGWAEPLLAEIARNPKVIIQPEIDQVDAQTLVYSAGTYNVPRGGFSWDLRYTWMEMPEHEKRRLVSPIQPFRTPTLVGCALAVQRDYFYHIGGFDDAMNIWGGENIELAFRNWMCGGEVLTHPCSRLGHVFKPFPYSFDGDRDKIVQKNLLRVADLWMDDYAKYLYASTWSWPPKRTAFTDEDRRSLEVRRQLKKRLGCKSFSWYLQNIVPEITEPPADSLWYGEVANIKSEGCWYVTSDGYVSITYYCFFHRTLPQNIFRITRTGRLMYKDSCIRVDPGTWLLQLVECGTMAETETWDLVSLMDKYGIPNEVIMTVKVNKGAEEVTLCVVQITNVNEVHQGKQMPQALPCDNSDPFAQWRWNYKFDFNHKFPNG